MDAFPDFLDKYYLLVPLVHELFSFVRGKIEDMQNSKLNEIKSILNLPDTDLLCKKLKPVF